MKSAKNADRFDMKRLLFILKASGISQLTWVIALTIMTVLNAQTEAKADEIIDSVDTVYMLADYGMGTYKSKLVDSNDTTGIVTYGLGTHAGQNKQLGVEYRVESQTTNFQLNKSKIATIWTSTIIKYRLWVFELGPIIGRSKVTSSREETEILDVVGSGYGGYFGMLLPVGRNNIIYANAMNVANSEVVDKKERTIALGSRLDMEIGARIGITRKVLDFTLGYRRRSNSISESGTAYAELLTSTFLGIQAGFDF
jgi:hypothetical protein